MRALFAALLVALVLTLPSYADAARLWSTGCELQLFEEDGTDSAMEWNASGSVTHIQSTTVVQRRRRTVM